MRLGELLDMLMYLFLKLVGNRRESLGYTIQQKCLM
jgi:hypothetical protein